MGGERPSAEGGGNEVVASDQSVLIDEEGVVGPVDSESGRQGESKRASLVVPTRVWHVDADPVQERE